MDWLAPFYNWIKVLHILAFVAWMAGMLYLPRIYIYHFQAESGGEAARLFSVMEKKLLKFIMNPAMIATWVFGLLMIAAEPGWGDDAWFLVKFAAVLAMTGLHGFFAAARKKFAIGDLPRTERFWRVINEAPFVLLILIVVMVIIKPFLA